MSASRFLLARDDALEARCKAEEVAGVPGAVLVEGVLSREECQRFIEESEEIGYDNATVPGYQNKQIDAKELRTRRNDRCVVRVTNDEELSLWTRLEPYCPMAIEAEEWGEWAAWGVNNMYRFYKYVGESQMFPVHRDNTTVKRRTFASWLTVLVYLSDDFLEGQTYFYPNPYEDSVASVKPTAGSVLLFRHTGKLSAWHAGAPPGPGGPKYVLRTDVMYESPVQPERCLRLSPPYDSDDEEADYQLPRPSLFSEDE